MVESHQLNKNTMLKFFKKKSEKEKLLNQYEALMEESFRLSKTNRNLSDQKFKEAQLIDGKISRL